MNGQARTTRAAVTALAAMLWVGAVKATAPGPVSQPATACGLLADQRLDTRGYAEARANLFQCASPARPLPDGRPVPHAIRYHAAGDRFRVEQLQLDLLLRSPGEVGPAYRELARLADLLVQRALGQPLPDGAVQAVLVGAAGTWAVAGSEVAVQRITGAEPALRFVIRIGQAAR